MTKEPLVYPSPRRKPGSRSLKTLDSGFRRNDGIGLNQHLPKRRTYLDDFVSGEKPDKPIFRAKEINGWSLRSTKP